MIQAEQIEIPFSKKRLIGSVIITAALVVVGIFGLFFSSSLPEYIWSILLVGFFGFVTVVFTRILIRGHPDIVINREGIKPDAVGIIMWRDIEEIKILTVSERRHSKHNYLLIFIREPQDYIDKNAKNASQRRVMKSYLNSYGTPIRLDAGDYKMSPQEILTLLNDKLERYKAWQSQNNAPSSPHFSSISS